MQKFKNESRPKFFGSYKKNRDITEIKLPEEQFSSCSPGPNTERTAVSMAPGNNS